MFSNSSCLKSVFEKLRFQNVFRPHESEAFSNSSGLKSVFEKLRFQNVFRPNESEAFSNSSGLKSVFEKLRFQNVFRPHESEAFSNSSGLRSVFEKLRFHDGLVWTVGLTAKNKAACLNSSGWDGALGSSLNIVYLRPRFSSRKC